MDGYEVETSSKITPSSIEGYSEYLVKNNLFDIPTHPLKFKDMSITLSGHSKLKMYLVLFHLVNILLELITFYPFLKHSRNFKIWEFKPFFS